MTMRRIDRKRLFSAEKLGKNVLPDINCSDTMKKHIISATQHREGHKLTTDIVVDLASSKQSLISGGSGSAANDIIGVHNHESAHICQVTDSVFGIVTAIETACLERPVGSAGILTGSNAYQLVFGTAADGKLNLTATGQTQIDATIGDVLGVHRLKEYDNQELKNNYIYFALGSAATGTGDSATATITVPTGSSVTDLVDSVTRFTLTDAGGTQRHLTASSAENFDAARDANEFHINAATSSLEIAEGITIAIQGAHSFAATRATNGSVITVVQSAAGVVGNRPNFFLDAPGKQSGITITDFTGGQTKGDASAITAGKFLLRFTGFVTPDDI